MKLTKSKFVTFVTQDVPNVKEKEKIVLSVLMTEFLTLPLAHVTQVKLKSMNIVTPTQTDLSMLVKSTVVLLCVKTPGEMNPVQKVMDMYTVVVHLLLSLVKVNGLVMIFITSPMKL
jgi:hypothetical protein